MLGGLLEETMQYDPLATGAQGLLMPTSIAIFVHIFTLQMYHSDLLHLPWLVSALLSLLMNARQSKAQRNACALAPRYQHLNWPVDANVR